MIKSKKTTKVVKQRRKNTQQNKFIGDQISSIPKAEVAIE